ncbi:hypothetical protein D3C85_1672910 [compost metagenome]
MLGYHFGCRLARVRNSKCKQKCSKVAALTLLNRLKQIGRLLGSETLQLHQILIGQCVQIS